MEEGSKDFPSLTEFFSQIKTTGLGQRQASKRDIGFLILGRIWWKR